VFHWSFITPAGIVTSSLTNAKRVHIKVTPNQTHKIDFTYIEKKVSHQSHHQIMNKKKDAEIHLTLTGIENLSFKVSFLFINTDFIKHSKYTKILKKSKKPDLFSGFFSVYYYFLN